MSEVSVDLPKLDAQFQKWVDQENNLSGLMNPKLSKIQVSDLQLKIKGWAEYKAKLKNGKIKNKIYSKKINEQFLESIENFYRDQDKITECQQKYLEFQDESNATISRVNVLNSFLSNLKVKDSINFEDL